MLKCHFIIRAVDDVVRRRGYGDHFVTMCVCMCGCVCQHDKTKTPDRYVLKLDTVVVLDTMSKSVGIVLKKSRVRVRVGVTTL